MNDIQGTVVKRANGFHEALCVVRALRILGADDIEVYACGTWTDQADGEVFTLSGRGCPIQVDSLKLTRKTVAILLREEGTANCKPHQARNSDEDDGHLYVYGIVTIERS